MAWATLRKILQSTITISLTVTSKLGTNIRQPNRYHLPHHTQWDDTVEHIFVLQAQGFPLTQYKLWVCTQVNSDTCPTASRNMLFVDFVLAFPQADVESEMYIKLPRDINSALRPHAQRTFWDCSKYLRTEIAGRFWNKHLHHGLFGIHSGRIWTVYLLSQCRGDGSVH